MKLCDRIAALLCTALALFCLLPPGAAAAGPIDPDRPVSLTLAYQEEQTPLAGASFSLHLVADVDAYGAMTPTAAFAPYVDDLDLQSQKEWAALAVRLDAEVVKNNIPADDAGQTDAAGGLTFPTGANAMTAGLYLVRGQRHTQNRRQYDAAPFLVYLPGLDEQDRWQYDVTSVPKFLVLPVVTPTPTPTPPPTPSATATPRPPADPTPAPRPPVGRRLPQTGQLWWPVPLLLAAGLALTAAGRMRRRKGPRAPR